MTKSIIIIGGGIAGLAAGCYGQMNGYQTKIFELHDIPGGLCTAWERKGYIFDGCLHYLLGSGPGQPFHAVLEELGITQGRQMFHLDEYMRIMDFHGHSLALYCDPDRLEAHMQEISPEDAPLITAFVNGIRAFTRFDMSLLQKTPKSLMSLMDWGKFGLRMMPFVLPMAKWARLSAREFSLQFKHPFLQRAIPPMFAWDDIPVMAGISLLASMYTRNAGVPAGGSLEVAYAAERRYLELGGEIVYKAQVEKILVEHDRAIGVRLYNDEVHTADYVISAADGHATIFDMLGGRYVNHKIKRLYDGHMPIYSLIQVSLGVNRDFSKEPHWMTYLLDEPVLIAGEPRGELSVSHYCYDPGMAAAGKSALVILLKTQYGYWQHIYGHRLYDSEQDQVADLVIAILERVYPGLRQDIEVIDVATPLSHERYTSNWLGATTGWLLTKDTLMMTILGVNKTLPGLKNLYLAGQWVEPGGMVPVVAMSGRNAIQLICHEDQKSFVAVKP